MAVLKNILDFFMSHTENICIRLTPNLSVAEINPYAQKILNFKKHDTFPKKLFEKNSKIKKNFTSPSHLIQQIKESPDNIFKIESNIKKMHIQWYVTAVFQKNTVEGFLVLGNDISKNKITEKYEGLESIIKHLPGNVYWVDLECRQMGCNENVLKMLGTRKEDYIGKTYEELAEIVGWKKGEEQFFKKDDMEVLTTGKPKYNAEEPPVMHKDGSIHYYITTRVPILNAENTIMGAAGISTDITELKATQAREKKAIQEVTEEQVRAEKEKALKLSAIETNTILSILSGSMAHDLRNPLGSILLKTEEIINENQKALSEIQKTANVPDFVMAVCKKQYKKNISQYNIAKEKVRTCSELIEKTLKMVKNTQAGIIDKSDFVICEIESVLNDILHDYHFSVDEKKKIYILDIKNFSFLAPKAFLYRVFINILNNAFQQIELKKEGNIAIRADIQDNFGLLYIKDTAGGVTQEIIDGLFEGYKTTKKNGTGVGLSFCKSVMQQLSGDLKARLVDGEFIEFILIFPLLSC